MIPLSDSWSQYRTDLYTEQREENKSTNNEDLMDFTIYNINPQRLHGNQKIYQGFNLRILRI